MGDISKFPPGKPEIANVALIEHDGGITHEVRALRCESRGGTAEYDKPALVPADLRA